MKRLALILCTFTLLGLITILPAQADANDFEFRSFEADYYLSRDDQAVGELRIEEQLVAVFPNFDQNHGIERAIPTSYKGNSLDLTIDSVTNGQGQALPYTTYESGDYEVLRIGDADRYVRGQQVYIINYRVRNVITFFKTHDELYWDTNGTGWAQPFDSVVARFHFAGDIASAQQEEKCFSGAFESQASDCALSKDVNGTETVITASASNLAAFENLSVVMSFESGTFAKDPTQQRLMIINIIGVVLFPLIGIGYSYNRWRKNGRDIERHHTVVAQYVPPAGLNSVSAGVIVDEQLNPNALSAGILELATLGYVSITEKVSKKLLGKDKKTYSVTLEKAYGTAPDELQDVAELLFSDSDSVGTTVQLDTLKNTYQDVQKLKKSIPKLMAKRGFFTVDPVKMKNSWALRAGAVIAMGIVWMIIFNQVMPLLGVGIIGAGVCMLLWIKAMPARTARGSQAYNHLLGLKEYIAMAEQDRLAFHQSPEGAKYGAEQIDSDSFKLRLYENLLPYALLFGLAEQWSEQFKDLYQQPPSWYNTNSSTGFNAVYLASSLNSFSSTATSSFVPQGSSSSGSSGFGGGGFSGGGGGGGGGGGW